MVVLNPVASNNAQKSNYDFSALAGKLGWEGDALTMQKVLRDEW
ncbi:MAG: hypothetical protein V7K89_11560 [Nostoc sp.]